MAGFDGGRILVSIIDSVFFHNEAQQFGGGIHFQDILFVNISHTIFSNNRALSKHGGGIYLVVRA